MKLIQFLLIVTATLPAQSRYQYDHAAMGTRFGITVATRDSTGLSATIDSAFARIDQLEAMMSDYRSDSELSLLAGREGRVVVSKDLWVVLRAAQGLAKRSGGAFDPTIGPLSKLWRRAFRTREFPDSLSLMRARSRVHWKHVKARRREGRIKLTSTDIRLDLGGIAKGYALDVVGEYLTASGFPAYLIDGGGDLLLGDPPQNESGWVISGPDGSSIGTYHNIAIATSGAEFRYLDWEGKRYSHIIDPRTGYGITDPKPVTVIGPSAMLADGLASVCSVLGEGEVFDPAAQRTSLLRFTKRRRLAALRTLDWPE